MDSNKTSRKYNSIFRKKLITKINRIKNKEELIEIYNIVINDIGNNFSSNRNGIFINLNLLSDEGIENILNYTNDKYNNVTLTETDTKINYKTYNYDDIEMISDLGHKLSNQEKTIIKRIRNKD